MKTFNVKNVLMYRITKDINLDAKAIEAALAPMAFTPCASQDMSRSGWTAPIATAGSLIHAANGYLLMRYRREQKILPAEVLQKHLRQRIAELEAKTVILPKLPVLGSNAEWYQGFADGTSSMRNECADAIRAAGIGVKGE